MSARKNSTVYPFSYHAGEKADNCISVRAFARRESILFGGVGLRARSKEMTFYIFSVQKPIARHLVVSARPAKPTRPDTAYEAPKREAYPDEVLTHRFRPYGDPGDLPLENHMDVEMVEVGAKEKERPKRKGGETGSSKKKKAKLVAS